MHATIARICTSFIDVPNKIAIAVYFSGCSIRCKDCHNKILWNPESGQSQSLEYVLTKISTHPLAQAVVFLGGEPTDQIEFLTTLCSKITDKEKVMYTGREFEALPATLLSHLDMIICGPYRADLAQDSFPASSNQRFFIKKGESWNLAPI